MKSYTNDQRTDKNATTYYRLSDAQISVYFSSEAEAREEMASWVEELKLKLKEAMKYDDVPVEKVKATAESWGHLERYSDASIYLEKVTVDEDEEENFEEIDCYTERKVCEEVLNDLGIDFD